MNTMSSTDANKKRAKSILIVCVFILYLLCLFYFLFFSENMGRSSSDEYRYNLTLLKEIRRFFHYRAALGWKAFAINIFGNVIVFMPFGYIVSLLLEKKRLFLATLSGLALSLFVEVIQLCLRIGSFDVDDLLLNTIGAFLGAVIYAIVHHRKKMK